MTGTEISSKRQELRQHLNGRRASAFLGLPRGLPRGAPPEPLPLEAGLLRSKSRSDSESVVPFFLGSQSSSESSLRASSFLFLPLLDAEGVEARASLVSGGRPSSKSPEGVEGSEVRLGDGSLDPVGEAHAIGGEVVQRGDEIGGGEGARRGGEGSLDAAGELVEGGLDGGVEVLAAVVVELGDGEVGLVGPELGGVAPGEGLVAEVGDEQLAVVAGAGGACGVDEARPGGVVELLAPDHVARREAADPGGVGIRRSRAGGGRGVLAGAAAAALGRVGGVEVDVGGRHGLGLGFGGRSSGFEEEI
nr:unnamed protein product [Digitaria exilis]